MSFHPKLTDIQLHQKARILKLIFANGETFHLSYEYLRAFSPSAETRAHDKKKLTIRKQNINIISIEPIGNYAIRPVFDDGHNTGLYTWETLYELATQKEKNWQAYLEKVKKS